MLVDPLSNPANIDRLADAHAHCLAGRFADAAALTAPLLDVRRAVDPQVALHALNLAAICALNLNRIADAMTCWHRAIALNPAFTDPYRHLAAVLKALARPEEAEAIVRQWLTARPDDADGWNDLGATCHATGRYGEAGTAYRRAMALRPGHADTVYNLGIALRDLGDLDGAETAFTQALAIAPSAEAYNNLGDVMRSLGRLADAEHAFRQALQVRPDHVLALNNLGNTLRELGRLEDAETAFRRALDLAPDFADAHIGLGVVLAGLDRPADAEAAYRRALSSRPDALEAYYNLGIVLNVMNRLAEAEEAYLQALSIDPALAQAHNNLGNVRWAMGRLHEAAAAYEKAIALAPDFAEAHHNLGCVLKEMGHLREAETAYRRALTARPDYHGARFSLATLLLGMGDFARGWPLYESRYAQPGFVHHRSAAILSCPQWRGESLAGKSLLIWQEDGLGDMLQFGRYLPLIKAQGAVHVTVACAAPLRRLFAAIDGVDSVLDHDSAQSRAADFACWTSLLSAPLYCGTTLDTIPPADYLRGRQGAASTPMPPPLPPPPGRKIGLVWKGNPKHLNDEHRSLPSLKTFAPLLSVNGLTFVSLQTGLHEDEAARLAADHRVLHLGSHLTDFADTAALIDQLDLVICVDTSIAHLAGSMGKPCWVLLPRQDVDWRWMHGRDDSPWYPHTLRLFRRAPADEDWSPTILRVTQALVLEHPRF